MKIPIRTMVTVLPSDWIIGEYKYLVDFTLSDSYLFIILKNEDSSKYIIRYSFRDDLNEFYSINETESTYLMRVYIYYQFFFFFNIFLLFSFYLFYFIIKIVSKCFRWCSLILLQIQ